MAAYGYDFHQTAIAKIEAAQRPLRVRELADFAALYGVKVEELVYAPTRSLPEIDREIDDVTKQLHRAQVVMSEARQAAAAAHEAARSAEAQSEMAATEVAVLQGRLDALRADREKLPSWELVSQPSLEESGNEGARNSLRTETPSIASAANDSPHVLRLLLGARFRRLREASGITAEHAANAIRSSRSKISRLETGRIAIKERDAIDLLVLYGMTDNEERAQLLEMARRSNDPGWWERSRDILPDWFEVYIGLEEAAARIRLYEVQYVPDLLQTDEYSRVLASQSYKAPSEEDVSRAVQFQAARKERVLGRRTPTHLHVVLDEAALRRQVGSETLMRAQLEHIIETAGQTGAVIQVLPLAARGQPAGEFRILEFSEAELPDVVYMQQLTGAIYLESRQDVDEYRAAMNRLISEALPPRESVMFLRGILAA